MNKKIKHIITVASVFLVTVLNAQTYTTNSNGDWSNSNTWVDGNKPGNYINQNIVVMINHQITINNDLGVAGELRLSPSGGLIGANRKIQINTNGVFENQGEVTVRNLELNSNQGFENALGAVIISQNIQLNGIAKMVNYGYLEASNNFSNNSNQNPGLINDGEFKVGNNLQNNGQGVINNTAASVVNITNNLTNNGNLISFDNEAYIGGNMVNNGNSNINIGKDAIVSVQNNLNNNSNIVVDGGLAVSNNITVNGGGSISGEGLLQAEGITNRGSIGGALDVCSSSGSDPFNRGGVSGNATLCANNGQNFPIQELVPLPIELAFFEVEAINSRAAKVKWQTATEINNYMFFLYKAEGKESEQLVYFTLGAGNSTTLRTYSYIDRNIVAGKVYKYELYQEDFDGTETLVAQQVFQSTADANEALLLLNVFPNPIHDGTFNVHNLNDFSYNANVSIMFKDGRLIQDFKEQSIVPGDNTFQLDKQLSAGMYLLIIQTETSKQVIKLMAQ